ncbi:interleukin-10 receptor subunit alpha [Pholidichthys leucotaenia]
MKYFKTPQMDLRNAMLVLVFFTICMDCVTGVPQPDRLKVHIVEEEVIVYWKHPVDPPSNFYYNVQMAKYIGEWSKVASCTNITKTYCDLTGSIHDYVAKYKVRVQLVAGNETSEWMIKRFNPKDGELQPPSFTLLATSSTLTVYVHPKPVLNEIFPYGLTHTIHLEEKGKEQQNITAYLKDDVGEEKRTVTFPSLRWGREYCVSIEVEANGAPSRSHVSTQQCLLLPEKEWFIIAVISLSILGAVVIIAVIAVIIFCYLRRSEKTPAALKSPAIGWHPLSIEEDIMEVVTNKGWFLSMYRTEVKNDIKDPIAHLTAQKNEEEDRRTSMDSGVSMESTGPVHSEGSPPVRQEDSGCGSMGGPDSVTSGQTDYPLQDDNDTVQKREDSGVGLGCQTDCSPTKLAGQDKECLIESSAGGNYHSQRPSDVQIHDIEDEDTFKHLTPDGVLAKVVTGYRAGPQSCICSGSGQCTWCHRQESGVVKQYSDVCIENGLLASKFDFLDSYKGQVTGHNRKTETDTAITDDLETTFLQLGEFPLLTSLPPLPPMNCRQDLNMNNVPLSLCDVQLNID